MFLRFLIVVVAILIALGALRLSAIAPDKPQPLASIPYEGPVTTVYGGVVRHEGSCFFCGPPPERAVAR